MINGRIPASALGSVPGSNAGLLRLPAASYTAMHLESLRRSGISLHLIDGSIGRAYRSYARQVIARAFWCGQGKCGNAASPGTSNHGWGITIDTMTPAQRAMIDQFGARYGFSKSWSDASWEWWHIKYVDQGWRPRPDILKKLGKRQRAAAERLLYHRRERHREAGTGIGRRWRRQDRWVRFWYKRVQRLYHRASGERKQVLGQVLKDRNGYV